MMSNFSPLYSPYQELWMAFAPLIALIFLWTIVLKGIALWNAARGNQKWWFIALLVINTLGILEIVYLLWYRPKSKEPAPAVSSSPAQ